MSSQARSGFSMGTIAGAPVRVGLGSVLVGFYIAFTLSQQWADRSSTPVVIAVSMATGALFLASILAHEAGHALVAKRNGIGAYEIRLSLFGGAAALERGAPDPETEMKVAGAGPAVNITIAVILFGVLFATSRLGVEGLVLDGLLWVAAINAILGLFNLLPGLPLDGGAVLTGYLWRRRKNRMAAVRTTAKVGRVLSYLLYVIAGYEIFVMQSFFGVYTAFIGMIFARGAEGELRRAEAAEQAKGRLVSDVMTSTLASIRDDANTATARAMLPSSEVRRYAVVTDDDGIARGLVTLAAIERAASVDGTDLVAEHMLPLGQGRAAYATEPLDQVLARGVLTPFVVIDEHWRPVALVESLVPEELSSSTN